MGWQLTRMGRNQLRYLLRMDRLCRDCIQHSDLVLASTREPATSRPDPSPPASAASVPAPAIVRSEAPFEVIQAKGKLWTGCKFTCADKANTLYCSGCDIEHSARAFSKTQTEMASEIRICIGREGVLQLCEHRHIKWADIEAHFLRQQDPESRNQLVATACELTCEHESHCTGPKRTNASMPRLHVSGSSRSRYDINWFWTAHHILNLDANYQMNADQVREAFQEDLRTVAGVMLTGTRNGDALNRAMSCFGKRWCTCFHHGEAKQSPTEESSAQTHCLFKRRALLNGQQHSSNIKSNTCYRRYRAEHIHVEPCKDSCVDHSEKRKACFSVKYSRSMGGTWMFMPQLPSLSNREGPLRPAVPPHEWLHALEPTSYELNDDTETVGEVWPVCRDMTCGNHYASYQTTHCTRSTAFPKKSWR
ncbi:hypothetical protein QBC41DRAFT_355130 [Cercophora samala]|uniref:Uncharacterized protein n=1 Tax=Cercophora samala TaxID=330535 RepID=A0AA40DBA0_9PEZI|nr:hypothetical protein QBC41DRAFT_355130 [Cercophora samala]